MSDYMKEMERLADEYATAVSDGRDDDCIRLRAALLAHAAQADRDAPVELPEPAFGRVSLRPSGVWVSDKRGMRAFDDDNMIDYGDAREAAGYARGVAEERERCAAICDRMGNPLNVKYEGGGCRKAAAAIRAAQKGDEL